MQQYWVAGLLLLLVPVTFFLLRKGDNAVKDEKPIVAKQKETPKESTKDSQTEQPQKPVIVHLPVHRTTVIAPDTLQSVIAQALDPLTSDTLSNIIVQDQTIPDTITTDTTKTIRKVEIPHYDITDLRHDKSKNRNDWHLALAYTGNPQGDMSRADNYMTMPSLSGSMTRSTKLYNWGDYMDYVMANAPMMDSVSASNMRHVAIINSNHPQDPLTRMKSTFESGNENTIIHRTQRLHYIGIPLKLGYNVVGGNRWSLYTTGGIQLDIPVSARLTTQYIYGGSYAPIGNSPDINATISAPWQWSVGVGIGAQYQIVPHLNVYLEPSLNYFIPTSTDVESYRTEHPFDLSLPFGIRFTW